MLHVSEDMTLKFLVSGNKPIESLYVELKYYKILILGGFNVETDECKIQTFCGI